MHNPFITKLTAHLRGGAEVTSSVEKTDTAKAGHILHQVAEFMTPTERSIPTVSGFSASITLCFVVETLCLLVAQLSNCLSENCVILQEQMVECL